MLDFGHLHSLDDVAHIIQVALTPVFMLSGIATLLNVFSTRLGRVSDRVDDLTAALEHAAAAEAVRLADQLVRLKQRSLVLDVAVVLGSLAGVATCVATLVLFVGALRDRATAGILFASFGLAILCILAALAAFVIEILLTSKGLRENVRSSGAETGRLQGRGDGR